MDRLRAMRVFVAVATAGSLSAAARKLNQPLSTVSRHLAALEDALGTSLIARNTRRLALTDAGRLYLETCRHVLDELGAVESRLGGRDDHVRGDLAITAPVVFGRLHVLPLLAKFLTAYPDVDARLLLVDRVVDLTEEGMDVAIRVGELPDSALVASKVAELRTVVCAAPAYLKRKGRPREPGDLAMHACISFATLSGEGRSWTFSSRAHGRSIVRIHARLAVSTADAAIDAAIAGLGVTRVLSYQAAAALKSKALVEVLAGYDDARLPVHVVRREVRRPSAQSRFFVEFAVRELRAKFR